LHFLDVDDATRAHFTFAQPPQFRGDQSKAVPIEKQKPLAGLLDGAL
jgi:hypothetical protein